jgi:integrase
MSKPRTAAPSAVTPHPFPDYAARIELCQYRRGPTNPTWEARYHIGGTWTGWTSLGTDSRDAALGKSIAKLTEREQAHRAGIKPAGGRTRREQHTVNEIAVTTLARLDKERRRILATQPAKKADKLVTKIGRIKSFILPALGERGIGDITEEDIERFRQGHVVRGGRPARGTIGNLNSAWLEILRDAVDLKHLSKLHTKRLAISQEGFAKGNRGSSFSVPEMQRLRGYMSDAWIAEGHHGKVREARYLLRALVSLLASTGLTPGLEVETLTPEQIEYRDDSHEQPALRIAVRKHQGKRAPDRIVWARMHDVWQVLADTQALQKWVQKHATDEYWRVNPHGHLFARPSDGVFPPFAEAFATVLVKLGMRRDPVSGGFRSLYSCRHYFATQSLMDGVPITFIAENMGNSERMVRDHYAHVITDLRSGQLTGSYPIHPEVLRGEDGKPLVINPIG